MFYSSAFCVVILISVASSVTRQQSAPLTSSDLVIAGLQYGSDTAAVRAQLGLPRRATVRDWKDSGLGVQLDSGHVTMLHLTSSRWQTQRGIRVGVPSRLCTTHMGSHPGAILSKWVTSCSPTRRCYIEDCRSKSQRAVSHTYFPASCP